MVLIWRRRGDLNSRAGLSRPTPLAGAPLRPTWVLLHTPRVAGCINSQKVLYSIFGRLSIVFFRILAIFFAAFSNIHDRGAVAVAAAAFFIEWQKGKRGRLPYVMSDDEVVHNIVTERKSTYDIRKIVCHKRFCVTFGNIYPGSFGEKYSTFIQCEMKFATFTSANIPQRSYFTRRKANFVMGTW